MRKLAFYWMVLTVIFLLGCSMAVMAIDEVNNNLSVVETVASSSSHPEYPPEYLTDHDSSTFWRLIDGSDQGWVELRLGRPSLIETIAIKGQLAVNTRLSVEYYQNGFWIPFVGTLYQALPENGRIDLSDERVVTDRIRITLRGNGASLSVLNEVGIAGREATGIYHKIKIKSVEASSNTSYLTRADFLTDGNTYTYWMTKPTNSSINNWLFETVEKYNGLTPDSTNETNLNACGNHGEVVFDFDSVYTLENINIFFTKDTCGNTTVEAFDGSQWKVIATIPERRTPGWYRVTPVVPVNAVKIRLSMDSACLNSVGGLSEVEFWGCGSYKGNEHILVGSQNFNEINEPINKIFSINAKDAKGYVLNLAYAGMVSEPVKVDLNGTEFTLQPSAQIRGNTIYRLPIRQENILDGTNYLRIYPQTTTQTLTYSGLIREGDGVQKSLTGDEIQPDSSDQVISLPNKTLVEAVEIRAENPSGISILVGENQSWQSSQKVESGAGWVRFRGPLTGTQIRISQQSENGIESVRILGSPITDKVPFIQINRPFDGQTFDVNNNLGAQYIGGYIDNPNAKVTINGVSPFQIGQYFGIQLVSIGPKPYEKTVIEAVVTDPEGRVGRQQIAVWIGNAPFIKLDQVEQVAYTSDRVYTISGNIAAQNCTVKVNGQAVSSQLGMFSTNVNLVEGFNRIKIEGFYQYEGQAFSEAHYCNVVCRSSDSGGLNLTIDSPQTGSCLNGTQVIVSGTVENLGQTNVTVNGQPATTMGDYYSATVSLAEGANTIVVTARDNFGGVAEKQVSVIRDTQPPVIDGIDPRNDAIITNNTVNVSARVHDDSSLTVLINGQVTAAENDIYQRMMTFPTDGVQTVSLLARDQAGNTSSAQVKIITDTQAPLPFEVKADPSGWTNNNRPMLTFATTDAGTGVDHYELSIDQGAYQKVASPFIMPVQADGEHIITIKAIDKAGLATTASTKIYIDTTPPAVPPLFRLVPGNGKMILCWNSPANDVVSYQIERTPATVSEISVAPTAIDYVDEGLVNGAVFSYRIKAIDHAGNMSPPSEWKQGIVGLTVTDYRQDDGTLVEYENVTLVIKKDSLPEGIKNIKVTEVKSAGMESQAFYPIISPIYQFTATATVNQEDVNLNHIVFKNDYVAWIQYDPAKVPEGFAEQNLGVYYFEPMWSRWFKIPDSMVDVDHHVIYFTTNHFTEITVQPTMLEDLSPQELKDAGYSPLKSSTTHGGVTVSPEGGTSMLSVTELVLPGRNGFDFVLKRTYDSATARGDAAGVNVNVQIDLSFGNWFNSAGKWDGESFSRMLDDFGAQALNTRKEAFQSLSQDFINRFKKIFQNSGDYAYSMGLGWRLNLPYIRGSNGAIIVRTPNGSFYSMNRLSLEDVDDPTGFYRKLRFENHEGEDFKLYATQKRLDLDASGIASNGGASGLKIPGWVLESATLIMKDGTIYEMDKFGRVTSITDPTGINHINISYNNLQLNYIEDSMGRKIHFDYDSSSFLTPVIRNIWIENDPRTITYDAHKQIGLGGYEGALLMKATDVGGREYNYDYGQNFLFSSSLGVKVNILECILDLVTEGQASKFTGMSDITIKAGAQCEWVFPLTVVQGPGIGYTKVHYDQRPLRFVLKRMTDYVLGLFPISYEVIFQQTQRLLVDQVQVYKTKESSSDILTTTFTYEMDYHGHEQFVNRQTVENNGRIKTIYKYNAITKRYIRFIDISDLAAEVINNIIKDGFTLNDLLVEDPYGYDVVPYQITKDIIDLDSNITLEHVDFSYDMDTMRPTDVTTHHGYLWENVKYAYDDWGNITYQYDHSEAHGRINQTETWMHYYNTNSIETDAMKKVPRPSEFPQNSPDEGRPRHDLLLYKIIKNNAAKEIADVTGITEVTDQLIRSCYGYTNLGQITDEAQWDGSQWLNTHYGYSSSGVNLGNLITKTDANGHITNYTYDDDGKFLSTITEASVADADGNNSDIVTSMKYDSQTGWKKWQKNPRGYVTEYNYDRLGRTTVIIAPDDDDDLKWTPDGTDRVTNPHTTIVYDDTALTSLVTDPLGRQTLYDFDELGRLVEIIKYKREGTQYLPYALTDIDYNAWGDIISITDPNRNKTLYQYDAMGRNMGITYPKAVYENENPHKSMVFDYINNVLTITDGLGNITTVTDDMQGRPISQVQKKDDTVIETKHYYDGLGNEVMTIDPNKNAIVNIYDGRNLLSKTVLPKASFLENSATETTSPYRRFQYDAVGRKTAEIVNTPGNGELVTTLTLDGLGKVIETSVPYSEPADDPNQPNKTIAKNAVTMVYYDPNGNKVKVVDANNTPLLKDQQKYLSYSYSAADLLLSERDPAGNTMTYTYDAVGNRLSMTDPRGNCDKYHSRDFTIQYEYDDLNRLVYGHLPAPAGQTVKPTVTLTYDPRGNLLERLEPDGLKTTYTYTPQNKLWTEKLVGTDNTSYTTEHRYDAAGNEVQIIDPRGYVTQKQYDTFNRLTDIIHPENLTEYESLEYDANGNRVGSIDGRRHLTIYGYDAYNRLISVRGFIKAQPITTNYYYDRLGNMTRMEDGKGYATAYAYDELNRLLTETDAEGHAKTYRYDAVGNRKQATDPNGTATTYSYTSNYLVESIILTNTAKKMTQTLAYDYDEAGFRKRASLDGVVTTYNTEKDVYTPDPYGRIFRVDKTYGSGKAFTVNYNYDIMGRMTNLTYPTELPNPEDPEKPIRHSVEYQYNALGQLTGVPGFVAEKPVYNNGGLLESITAINGVKTTYQYDKNNRLSSLSYDNAGTVLKEYTYGYDGANNIIMRTKNGFAGTEVFQYDDLNQLIYASINGNFEKNTADDRQLVGKVQDDQLGKKSMQIESQVELPADQLEVFQLDYAAGSIGVDLQESVNISRLLLTPNSPAHRVKPRNISVFVSEDNVNYNKVTGWQLAALKNGGYEMVFKTPVQGRYIKVHCHYDERDKKFNAVRRTNEAFANTPAKLIKVYFYVNNRMEWYQYDNNGNRSLETIAQGNTVIRSYTYYDNSNKLQADTRFTYEYDANGNLTKKTSLVGDTVVWDYSYDLLNRLTQVKKNDQVVASYRYDDGGLRIAKTGADGKQTYYVFDLSGNIITEQEDKAYMEYIYVLGKHFARVDGTTDSTETTKYFYQTDHQGSTVMVTDKDGNQVWSGEYTPFGTVNSEEGELKNAAKFTGKDLDEDTGLYYFNARWYDQDTGRFVEEDPERDPNNPNLYAYCGNNPLNRLDPDGRAVLEKGSDGVYEYHAGNKTIDTFEAYCGAIPFVGLAVPIAHGIQDLINPTKKINLKDKRQIQTILGGISTSGTYIGYLQQVFAGLAANGSKLMGTVSKVSGILSWIGTGAGVIQGTMDLFDKSYEVEKAVELTYTIGWDSKEKAVMLAVYAENAMEEMLDNGQVKLVKNKDGVEKLIWVNKEAEKEYFDTVWKIKNDEITYKDPDENSNDNKEKDNKKDKDMNNKRKKIIRKNE